eukprot:11191783-Lingulodinium_polyedra.AAC.1
MVLTGDASKVVRVCEKGSGFETSRRSCWKYEPPNHIARQGVVLAGLLHHAFEKGPNADLLLE